MFCIPADSPVSSLPGISRVPYLSDYAFVGSLLSKNSQPRFPLDCGCKSTTFFLTRDTFFEFFLIFFLRAENQRVATGARPENNADGNQRGRREGTGRRHEHGNFTPKIRQTKKNRLIYYKKNRDGRFLSHLCYINKVSVGIPSRHSLTHFPVSASLPSETTFQTYIPEDHFSTSIEVTMSVIS